MNEQVLYDNPLEFYEYLLLGPLTMTYYPLSSEEIPVWQEYSNLLIDKFAIHSSSFFHLSKGIIERKKSGEVIKQRGYDLFTVNSTIRAIIETYSAFNHIFVEPKTSDEKKFRFLLWKLDGLFQKQKLEIYEDDFEGAKEILDSYKLEISKTINEIETSNYKNTLSDSELLKIYNLSKKRISWRFLVVENKVRPLKIIELVKHTCKQRAFVNVYKDSSIHLHSNYPSLEYFKGFRGKVITKEFTDPLVRLAIYLTSLMIHDICFISNESKKKFELLPVEIKDFISGISKSIKEEH
ncbi:DUF5677 domain-containing protein [Ochrovirga pacifica]|uniref:DUF5677 domain-containing protein n=1 Tax=Ochrovirga pacifica TaxID=1042376 RepID=UPI0002559574|nr:DUF5677 domain-containing protein [Ochrovirga pacifica]